MLPPPLQHNMISAIFFICIPAAYYISYFMMRGYDATAAAYSFMGHLERKRH